MYIYRLKIPSASLALSAIKQGPLLVDRGDEGNRRQVDRERDRRCASPDKDSLQVLFLLGSENLGIYEVNIVSLTILLAVDMQIASRTCHDN